MRYSVQNKVCLNQMLVYAAKNRKVAFILKPYVNHMLPYCIHVSQVFISGIFSNIAHLRNVQLRFEDSLSTANT